MTKVKPSSETQEAQKVAVLSLSGGADSAALLAWVYAQGYQYIYTYSFNYNQTHQIELRAAEQIAKRLKIFAAPYMHLDTDTSGSEKDPLYHIQDIQHHVIDLTDVFAGSQSALCRQVILDAGAQDTETQDLIVENRNVIFSAILYSKACALQKTLRSQGHSVVTDVLLGVHSNDQETFPDCTPESFEACQQAFKISNVEQVNLKAPFIKFSKAQVLQIGIDSLQMLGWSYSSIQDYFGDTISCYQPFTGKSCGHCAACKQRIEAFSKCNYNNMQYEDTMPYLENPEDYKVLRPSRPFN